MIVLRPLFIRNLHNEEKTVKVYSSTIIHTNFIRAEGDNNITAMSLVSTNKVRMAAAIRDITPNNIRGADLLYNIDKKVLINPHDEKSLKTIGDRGLFIYVNRNTDDLSLCWYTKTGTRNLKYDQIFIKYNKDSDTFTIIPPEVRKLIRKPSVIHITGPVTININY